MLKDLASTMLETLSQPNTLASALVYDEEPRASKSIELQGHHGKWTFLFVWLFGFVLFCRPEDIFPILGALHLTLVFAIAGGVLLLRSAILRRVRIAWSRELKLVLFLTAWFAIGVPFAFYRRGAFELLTGTWLRTLLFFFLLTQTLTTIERIRKMMWVLLLSELIASALSVLMQGNPLVMVGDRLAGINKGLLGWNFLGITLSTTMPFTAYLYLTRKSVWRTTLLLAALGSSLWMVVLTASRGGFVGLILSLVLTWWLLLRKSARGKLAVTFLLVSLVLASTKAPAVFWQRLATVWSSSGHVTGDTSESAEESTEGRLYLAQQSLVLTIENPVFGLGVNNFPYYTGAKIKGENAWLGTHNTYTQISSETGIPGLLLLVLLLGTILRHALAAARNTPASQNQDFHYLACALFASGVVFCFQGFFAHLGYECLLYYIAALVAALGNVKQTLKGANVNPSESKSIFAATISSQEISPWS